MNFVTAADTGGTFTDLVAVDPVNKQIRVSKSLTTYDDPMRGVMDCVRKANVDFGKMNTIKFGTTLVINAFLQRTGARTALVTTRGFRDVIEIRRGNRATPFDLTYQRDPVLVPRHLRFEVTERVDAQGQIRVPLVTGDVAALADTLRAENVEAVAVSFLNSYANAEHEKTAVQILQDALPGIYVTSGTELTREWYEFERTSTVAANAYVGPLFHNYLTRMTTGLADGGFRSTSYMMSSNGGVLSLDHAERQPVQLVESGPVGGCIGASVYARELGLRNVIAFDMGGTTAKCAVVENGLIEMRSPYYVGGPELGFPIRGSVIDILEVGAGGGSIAWIDDVGRLAVGPRSAGSTPGPACYGRGGTQPTITDANVVLGRIGEASFLGGELTIDRAAAAKVIHDAIGAPLGYGRAELDRVAQGVIDLGAMTMSTAIKQISIERGNDPREFALFVFGGGGPLHGGALAREIGIPLVIVPPQPGLFSAIGMLLADAKADETRTFIRALDADAANEMATMLTRMTTEVSSRLPAGSDLSRSRIERYAELRYKGQRHALKTDVGNAATIDAIRTAFHQAYFKRYGHQESTAPLEFVSISVMVSAPIHGLTPAALIPAVADGEVRAVGQRSVYFGEVEARLEANVYRRDQLPTGSRIDGPAVIEEYGSCTIVGPHDVAEIGRLGEINLRIDVQ
ncbi:hydantoinase/oxoprolinase family protein [Paraburkholderia xenovorans LB400]|uniref:5-oxoprolinase (ATP-hydrolyzing) n=1 Tax=Paraburkholderia xenovorans (strain LB400) TaxID=266265 RepID=Q13G62_PARXL|nr:hydantoinase/oxoprolinase family protein [Paraburkholderia xenovorans]ABE36927.1 5-oxoprolinase (ATP-hydrolyzing) [Paraburkholderia xenovorans LB400]AIP33935.1 hydantoinase/oxoprolinase family protein [Paraburkholderia xenovorans LB400]